MASYEDEDTELLFHPDEDWSDFLEWEPEIRGAFTGLDRLTTRGILNATDYNLNSPLIADHSEAILARFNNKGLPARYLRCEEIETQVTSLQHLTLDWGKTKASNQFHSWVASKVYQRPIKTRHLIQIWNENHDESTLAMSIVREFWQHLTEHELPNESALLRDRWSEPAEDKVSQRLVADGETYWFFHVVTLMANSASPEEREALVDSTRSMFGTRLRQGDKGAFCFEGWHRDYGLFAVGPGVLVLIEENRLLDRNMILMIKDTMVARFCTKLTLLTPDVTIITTSKLSRLTDFYYKGDQLMIEFDNDVFDVLQLLEPFCNARLSDLAGAARPLIPKSLKFHEFLESEAAGFERRCPLKVGSFFWSITREEDYKQVLLYFGTFRHWGHPFIDYLEGLKKLHSQVTLPKTVDETYAKVLASDLAFIVLKHEFDSRKRWFVDPSKLDDSHPLKDHIINCTWPTPAQIQDIGDIWADLPILPCYEIPPSIDPSALYADKSHSPDRSVVLNHVSSGAPGPIPSRKVLDTVLKTEQVDLREFLQMINDEGLDWESLVIGLKGKEREIKKIGRFFSLMSWKLRYYFVSTEYLIKTFFVPLFHGLTMADDLKSLTKKIIESSIGHGHDHYQIIGFANHLDYEKWNNHQRKESTSPVFTVMGQFFGLPNLFARTHEFFEKSLIYYGDRPDLMRVENRRLLNNSDQIVCWEGQKGGLEGLRQKGWSVLNLLVILREARVRNTKVRTLAQGDNQVICTQYKLPGGLTNAETQQQAEAAFANNEAIMSAIIEGTDRLGLIINQKETLVSSDYLSYGKIPVFRGNIEAVESKRYSRVACIPNDQIPSLSNAVSAVATNSLTVAQFSRSIKDPMINYCFFACFVLSVLKFHSPLLRGPLLSHRLGKKAKMTFFVRALYLDPSLGGVSGMSLTRFLIRMFPDPVTEGLSFWKIIYRRCQSPIIQNIALGAGNPRLAAVTMEALTKLIEKPNSLNIPKGLSATTLLKNEIRKHLMDRAHTIPNQLVSKSLTYLKKEEAKFLSFLRSVKPLFPRFLSEFYAATFLGVTESIVGLFQNSRTIRTMFSWHFSREIGELLRKSELLGTRVLASDLTTGGGMWDCSATRADELRERSWGSKVYGTTVPHPIEMLSHVTTGTSLCDPCMSGYLEADHVAVCYPQGLSLSGYKRGKMCAYLGSNTMESTSLFMPWEKEVKSPLLDRASKLRSSINWFVEADSKLAKSILANLRALTGLDWEEECIVFVRTGSALHRFYCSRQSCGGFASTSPSALSWVLVTTDTMPYLATKNHDFMYQSLLLYSQLVSLERNMASGGFPDSHHFHLGCKGCVREIEEITLEADWELDVQDVSEIVSKMSGGINVQFSTTTSIPVPRGSWEQVSDEEKCFYVGVAQGALFGFLTSDNDSQAGDSSIFPANLTGKLFPKAYLMGVLQGLAMASAYNSVYRRSVMRGEPRSAIIGGLYYLIDNLCRNPGFIVYLNSPNFVPVLTSVQHRIPPSYPSSARHAGSLGTGFFQFQILSGNITREPWVSYSNTLWIFSDFRTPRLTGLMVLSHRLWELLKDGNWNRRIRDEVVSIKEAITYFCSRDRLTIKPSDEPPPDLGRFWKTLDRTRWCPQEVRHAVQELTPSIIPVGSSQWSAEWVGQTRRFELDFSSFKQPFHLTRPVPRFLDPLISGLRPFQFATGAHYKLRSILKTLPPIRGFLCGGDGSGGMTAAILRWSPEARGIFNSLLDLSDRHLRGVAPSPPSAIVALPAHMRDRCVNWKTCWKDPSDLSQEMTWVHFAHLAMEHSLQINLIVLDMEVVDDETADRIEDLTRTYLAILLAKDGCLVYKMYGTREERRKGEGVSKLGSLFLKTYAVTTQVTSLHSSEFYLVGETLIKDRIMAPHVTPESLSYALTHLPACRPYEEEFSRAIRLDPTELMAGIPTNLVPSAGVEFTAIFSELGLETGVAAQLSQLLDHNHVLPVEPLGLMLTCLILLSNSILNITRWVHQTYSPPSDQRLQKLLSGFVGTWEFCAWLYKNYYIWKRTRVFLDSSITFCYHITERHAPTRSGWGLEWDWFTPRWRTKKLIKLEHPATVGQVIRVWSRYWGRTTKIKIPLWPDLRDTIHFYTQIFNRGLIPDDVLHHTGLFYPLYGPRSLTTEKWLADPSGDVPLVTSSNDVPWDDLDLSWSG